jgi:hypothetical protein
MNAWKLSVGRDIIERMFDPERDPEEWEPIPASELASIGGWEIPDVPGQESPIPAGLDDLVHEAQLAPLGPGTLSLLLATPPELLSEEGRSLGLRVLTGLSRSVEALAVEFTAAIAGPTPATLRDRQDDFASNEVAVATICSVYAADRRVWLARDLSDRLALTAGAMARGEISLAQARALSDATCQLDVEVARAIEAKILRYAFRQDLNLFKTALRRWVAKLDPDFTERATTARAEVEVSHTAHDDGTGQLYIRGPLEITTAIHMALTAYAAKTNDLLGGTVAQRKLAGLRDMAELDLGSPDTPRHHGRLPTVNVTIDLATLLGLTNHPAEIPGVGPIPADAARWLLADGAPLRRLIIDPMNGQLLDYGQTTYTVPADLADYLIATNITSAAPHSSVDARVCDMEHNIPYDHGGPTNPINCTPVDRRWHRPKTLGRWHYRKRDDGVIIWTSPTGLACQIDPYDYRAEP